MAFEISLFGKFQVRREGQPLTGLEAPKVQQLLSYLLLYRERPHPREALAHLLWDGDHTDHPGKRLRKTLWRLRNALAPPPGSREEPLLEVDLEWIQINGCAELWLDTCRFEQALVQTHGLSGSALDAERAQTLRQAVDLYRGGLQESWYQDWYLYERERFRHGYLVLLDKLMAYCEAQRCYEEGLTYGTLILRNDPASERTHRLLISFPFGTLAYLFVYADFDKGAALAVLSLLFLLKLLVGGALVATHQRFLENKGLVLMLLTTLLVNVVFSFLFGLLPGILAAIVDALAAIVAGTVAIIRALILAIGAIVAIVLALKSLLPRVPASLPG